MCGIAGFHFPHQHQPPEVRQQVLQALRQRGPDAQHERIWSTDEGQVHTGWLHARLAIMDPRPEADQPMLNAAGDIALVYNGEVYDWQQYVGELTGLGLKFHTRSDTEFILNGYQAWGIEGLLPRLRGMFAFAILDWTRQRIYLVRDRMGLKPLVYSHSESGLAFASTVRALLPLLSTEQRQISSQAIDAYLAHRYIPAPATIFAGARRLENAHYLEYSMVDNSLKSHAYWSPVAVAADWQSVLDEAVAIRSFADRPLGIFLSGGIDSAVVAASLVRQQRFPQAFTAVFSGSAFDESAEAAETARILGLPQQLEPIVLNPAEDFSQLIADLDEPFADPSALPLWALSRATSQQVKVVLGGDGGDELFGGYKRYAQHLRSQWRAGWRGPQYSLSSLKRKGWVKNLTELGMDWWDAYSLRFSGFALHQRRALQPDLPALPATYWRKPSTHSPGIQGLIELDWLNYLPEYVLRKADLCTMAHGLELRAPLLDHHWLQAVLALPDSQRFSQPAKACLWQSCPLPLAESLKQRPKRGFNPPLHAWLQQDLRGYWQNLAQPLQSLTQGQLSAKAVQQLLDQYQRDPSYAEQVLQLVILAESLQQLSDFDKART